MKLTKEKKELVLRLPLLQNSYDAIGEYIGKVDNLIGVCVKKENYYTIAQLCDLAYKGTRQEGSPYIMFDTEEDLREACDKFGLQFWERESYVKITKKDIENLIINEIVLATRAGEKTSRLTRILNEIKK